MAAQLLCLAGSTPRSLLTLPAAAPSIPAAAERCPTAPHVCADCGMLISGYGINKLTAACEDCQIDGCSNCESDPSWCDDCQERLILTKTSAGQECTPVSGPRGQRVCLPGTSCSMSGSGSLA